ncbi:hypothetical protein MKZ38_005424 [Zalerion maritima]|uniref:Uncharacterized protein n=1 Tax=Zalerion maritima TaxID=339359 RepID=A0AAD5WR00_9PEZI|nr:hypothetical protein MKZ38_005424 [Zalerion maritima]
MGRQICVHLHFLARNRLNEDGEMLSMLLEARCDPECTFMLSDSADNITTHAISLRRHISNSQRPAGVDIPMGMLRGSHHLGVTGSLRETIRGLQEKMLPDDDVDVP